LIGVIMRVRKVKVISESVGFPGDELLRPIDPGIPFPEISSRHMINCSLQDLSGVTFKPHMLDAGSCQIPNGYTITYEQWLWQQERF
jgi:hypothetical protein